MIRGRHRGLPLAIDRAVLLPSDLVQHGDDAAESLSTPEEEITEEPEEMTQAAEGETPVPPVVGGSDESDGRTVVETQEEGGGGGEESRTSREGSVRTPERDRIETSSDEAIGASASSRREVAQEVNKDQPGWTAERL